MVNRNIFLFFVFFYFVFGQVYADEFIPINFYTCDSIDCKNGDKIGFDINQEIYLYSNDFNYEFDYNIYLNNTLLVKTKSTLPILVYSNHSGDYKINISGKYNDIYFSKQVYYYIKDKDKPIEKPIWIAKLDENNIAVQSNNNANLIQDKNGFDSNSNASKIGNKINTVLIIIIGLFIVLILFYLFSKKVNSPKKFERKKIGFFIVFICLFFMFSNTYAIPEFNDNDFRQTFQTPKIININLTDADKDVNNIYLKNIFIPILVSETSQARLLDFSKPINGNIKMDVIPVYLIDYSVLNDFRFEYYDENGLLRTNTDFNSENIDYFINYYLSNPILAKDDLIKRTRDNLVNLFGEDTFNYLVSYKLNGKSLFIEKDYLLKFSLSISDISNLKEKSTITSKLFLYTDFEYLNFGKQPINVFINYQDRGIILYNPNERNNDAINIIASEKGWDLFPIEDENLGNYNNIFEFDISRPKINSFLYDTNSDTVNFINIDGFNYNLDNKIYENNLSKSNNKFYKGGIEKGKIYISKYEISEVIDFNKIFLGNDFEETIIFDGITIKKSANGKEIFVNNILYNDPYYYPSILDISKNKIYVFSKTLENYGKEYFVVKAYSFDLITDYIPIGNEEITIKKIAPNNVIVYLNKIDSSVILPLNRYVVVGDYVLINKFKTEKIGYFDYKHLNTLFVYKKNNNFKKNVELLDCNINEIMHPKYGFEGCQNPYNYDFLTMKLNSFDTVYKQLFFVLGIKEFKYDFISNKVYSNGIDTDVLNKIKISDFKPEINLKYTESKRVFDKNVSGYFYGYNSILNLNDKNIRLNLNTNRWIFLSSTPQKSFYNIVEESNKHSLNYFPEFNCNITKVDTPKLYLSINNIDYNLDISTTTSDLERIYFSNLKLVDNNLFIIFDSNWSKIYVYDTSLQDINFNPILSVENILYKYPYPDFVFYLSNSNDSEYFYILESVKDSSINIDIHYFVLDKYKYNCETYSYITTLDTIINVTDLNRSLDNKLRFKFSKDYYIDNVIYIPSTFDGNFIDLIIAYDPNNQEPLDFFDSNKNKVSISLEEFRVKFNISYPIDLEEYISQNSNIVLFNKIYSELNKKLDSNNDINYKYLLLLGDKFDIPQIYLSNLEESLILDHCYVNKCYGITEKNRGISVGRLPFTNKVDMLSYYDSLPYFDSNVPSIYTTIYPDNYVLFTEYVLYPYTSNNIIPTKVNINFENKRFLDYYSEIITSVPNNSFNFVFNVNPKKEDLISAINNYDAINIYTHGSNNNYSLSAFDKSKLFVYDLLASSSRLNNRPGIITESCNTAYFMGEYLLKAGSKYYFGSVFPSTAYITINPLPLKNDEQIGEFVSDLINYAYSYLSYTPDSDFDSYPFILFGDPSINLIHPESSDSVTLEITDSNIFIYFNKFDFKQGLAYSSMDLTDTYTRKVDPDNLTESSGIVNYQNNLFEIEYLFFYYLSDFEIDSLLSNLDSYIDNNVSIISKKIIVDSFNWSRLDIYSSDYWKKIRLSSINNTFYFTDNIIYFQSIDYNKNINANNLLISCNTANIYVNNELILTKKLLHTYSKGNEYIDLYLTYNDFLKLLKAGIHKYNYTIEFK